jgi:hypothetical protein
MLAAFSSNRPLKAVSVTLDHVTTTQNADGGIKIDMTNGPVTMDMMDSVFSKIPAMASMR